MENISYEAIWVTVVDRILPSVRRLKFTSSD